MALMPLPETIDRKLLEDAAEWVLRLRFGASPSQGERDAFERWRDQSAAHRRAWARAEKVLGAFQGPDADVCKETLRALPDVKRRRALRLLSVALIAVPTGLAVSRFLPWAEWHADVATATGERRTVKLADGSTLVLNTASAVDIAFTQDERRLVLRAGEILVTTHADPASVHRPFLVQVPQGDVRALGTRFGVRLIGSDRTRVMVLEHAVQARPGAGAAFLMHAGEQAEFNRGGLLARASTEPGADLWERGFLVARNMRLADVVAEIGRYRSGFVRCAADIADLRVSGVISIADSDVALDTLAQTLPVKVRRLGRYWAGVEHR